MPNKLSHATLLRMIVAIIYVANSPPVQRDVREWEKKKKAPNKIHGGSLKWHPAKWVKTLSVTSSSSRSPSSPSLFPPKMASDLNTHAPMTNLNEWKSKASFVSEAPRSKSVRPLYEYVQYDPARSLCIHRYIEDSTISHFSWKLSNFITTAWPKKTYEIQPSRKTVAKLRKWFWKKKSVKWKKAKIIKNY